MGVAEFLSQVLPTVGRPLDLRDFKSGIVRFSKPPTAAAQPAPPPASPEMVAATVEAASSATFSSSYKRRKRSPLRIAIDVSSWVYKAAHGFGDILGDERHLSNFGRATLHQEQQQQQLLLQLKTDSIPQERVREFVEACTKYLMMRLETLRDTTNSELLVVLDGTSPPIKELEVQRRRDVREAHAQQRDEPVDPLASPTKVNAKRTKAFRRAGAGKFHSNIIQELLKALKQQSISYLVAPYEADGQLAYLSQKGYVDLIVTEDSDLIAHGANAILYKAVGEIGNGIPKGILLKFNDIGSLNGKRWDLQGFSPVMMAVLFVAVGCDYCDKLLGIGLVTASRIVKDAFLSLRTMESTSSIESTKASTGLQQSQSPLAQVFSQLYKHSYSSNFPVQFKEEYENQFMAALIMYRHPIVFDPIQRKCIMVGTEGNQFGDPELRMHEPYASLCDDFETLELIVGDIPDPETSIARAEGRANGNNTTRESEDPQEAGVDLEFPQLETQRDEPSGKEVQDEGTTPTADSLVLAEAVADSVERDRPMAVYQFPTEVVAGSAGTEQEAPALGFDMIASQFSTEAVNGSVANGFDETDLSERSPNLLQSSTPERTTQSTVESQKTPSSSQNDTTNPQPEMPAIDLAQSPSPERSVHSLGSLEDISNMFQTQDM